MEQLELEWGGMKHSRPAMEKGILNHKSWSRGLAVIFRQVDRYTEEKKRKKILTDRHTQT